jgi:predicted acyl esterase
MAVLRYALPCAAVIGIVGLATLAGAQTDVIATVLDDPSVLRSSFYLPVRDGTRLAVNVYRPADGGTARNGRFPVVFAFTPYRARYRKDGAIVDLIDSTTFGLRSLVHAGYVVATADVRGKGASFGARRGFLDQTEAHDGYDIVQWLATRPYSTGKVGITGCSYLGGSAMLVAGALPPALKAVFAAATDIDKYAFVRNGGITAQFNTRPDETLDVDLASVRSMQIATAHCSAPRSPAMPSTRRWRRSGRECRIAIASRRSPATAIGKRSAPTPISRRCAARSSPGICGEIGTTSRPSRSSRPPPISTPS